MLYFYVRKYGVKFGFFTKFNTKIKKKDNFAFKGYDRKTNIEVVLPKMCLFENTKRFIVLYILLRTFMTTKHSYSKLCSLSISFENYVKLNFAIVSSLYYLSLFIRFSIHSYNFFLTTIIIYC